MNDFQSRHIGWSAAELDGVAKQLDASDAQSLIERVIPSQVRTATPLRLPEARTEPAALAALADIARGNRVTRAYIGQGYYGTVTPQVLQRNILENPAWYTAYTPYQPEISQGRLEALVTFQTMVSDLTGLEIANASLLDEGTAAAEAITLLLRTSRTHDRRCLVDRRCHPRTIAVIRERAAPLNISIELVDPATSEFDAAFGLVVAYPGTDGSVQDLGAICERAGAVPVIAVTDLLALTLLESPGALGARVAVGSAQRFGVPLGGGGPHAAFIATDATLARQLPGRLVGVSQDRAGNSAYRLALQTREQHIRRERATSNICTAQVLLANLAAMYAVHHGPDGLRGIASRVHGYASRFVLACLAGGLSVDNETWFDTVSVRPLVPEVVRERCDAAGIRVWDRRDSFTISFDETVTEEDFQDVLHAFGVTESVEEPRTGIPSSLRRHSPFLTHEVFHRYRSETELMRYLTRLAQRDLALDRTMIPLGSCTMKLNAAAEMAPISWPEFNAIHPLAPLEDRQGFIELDTQLRTWLCEITGYDEMSLQPNAGSQGEYAGLLAIRAYHRANGQPDRSICLIPASAHGTNAASAVMAGFDVVVVACDERGNVDLDDLRGHLEAHEGAVGVLMVTYPSTHGVFETEVVTICDLVHAAGGQVYLDGANMNALVGWVRPGELGADVGHLNLHKTFCIPHGGGGPGVGPVGVKSHLAPYLPRDIASAPLGSASILPITWMYIAMMGPVGLRSATSTAILAANYVARQIATHFPVLYSGAAGDVAHEALIDIRGVTRRTGVTVEDIAKRLIDYGFHAPTMSFPVAGTLMIEPTESESLDELDRFCQAMNQIGEEIGAIERGEISYEDSPLWHAPHTLADVLDDGWNRAYSRRVAAASSDTRDKYWPPVGRIDAAFGDRNLVCTCPPIESYARD